MNPKPSISGPRFRRRIIPLAALALLTGVLLCRAFFPGAQPEAAEFSLTSPFFSGRNVLVLVPHQDDELNLTGGLLEQYLRGGSRVTIVYSTNGDYAGQSLERSLEALAVADRLGVPRENVIYMGYGDQWEPQEQQGLLRKHLYSSVEPEAVWTSHFGARQTYGTDAIDCWEVCSYTRANFMRNLLDILRSVRPDVIFCTDYDPHHDHMALDLFFGEAMGILLAEDPDYHPQVYKGFCHATAWKAPADFVGAQNILSCRKPTWEFWDRLEILYNWEDRVRLPMGRENISRLLSENSVYRCLRLFESQNAHQQAPAVLSGDKVFFRRRTDSLLYRAAFTAGGEIVSQWNDFKLKDSTDFSVRVNTGVRYGPEILVTLPQPVRMDQLWLYDASSPSDNITGGYVVFDDGTRLDFGPLNPGGDATVIPFPERTVSSFTLFLPGTEGSAPGLTEIEAYLGDPESAAGPQLLMAVDEDDNFVYDYRTDPSGRAVFSLYAYPAGTVDGWEDVQISSRGQGCSAKVEDDLLRITCPEGRQMTVTIRYSDEVQTTFTVRNPSADIRLQEDALQAGDAQSALEPLK